MAAARAAVRGLSTEELETIRDALATGRKPRVLFTESAGQVAGQHGQVVELTDPALSDEWVVVRFGNDELPFSPTDLAIPARTRSSGRRSTSSLGGHQPAPRAAASPKERPDLKLTQPPVPVPREEQTMSTTEQTPPAKSASKSTASAAGKPDAPASPPPQAKPARKATGRAAKAKGPAGLTVTLAYADGEWTLTASQGSKAVAKPYVIRPAEALKMVGLLEVPAVHQAVEQIVSAERAEAERQAEKLRAELAEVEARLAALRDAA